MEELKRMKSTASTVFVDSKDKSSLPKDVQSALNSAGGSYPLLVFMSPDLKKTYASFSHKSLKGQEYRDIFRDAKKKIKEAKKNGELKSADVVAVAKEETAEKAAPNGAVMIKDPEMLTWKSAKGSEIVARLVKFENSTFYLKNARGKVYEVVATDLTAESQDIANKLVEANKASNE